MNYKGKLIDLDEKVVMAIINVTTDSFYDGSRYSDNKEMIGSISNHLSLGASIIDLGACSTRPGSEPISEEEEILAIERATTIIKEHFSDVILSIDTFRHKVAQKAMEIFGEVIVNDVYSGDADTEMLNFVANNGLPYIAMHQADIVGGDVVGSVVRYFAKKLNECERKGIKDTIIDVGFGFNKSLEDNYRLVREYEKFGILERKSLVGISRKSMIWRTLESSPTEALNGTTTLNSILLNKGANILRVHDTKEAVECIKIIKQLEC